MGKQLTQTSRARIAVGGFACMQGFLIYLFYMGVNRGLSVGPLELERAELLCTLFFLACALVVLCRVPGRARDLLLSQGALWICAAGAALGAVALRLASADALWAFVAAGALAGASSGLMLAAWGRALGADQVERSVPEVLIGSAAGAAACFAAGAALGSVNPAFTWMLVVLPFGSAAALCALSPEGGLSRAGASESAVSRCLKGDGEAEGRSASQLLSLRIVSGAVLFGFSAGVMQVLGSDPGMKATPTLPVTLLLFVAYCLAALQLFGRPQARSAASASSAADLKADAAASGPWGFASQLVALAQGESDGPLDGAYRLAALLLMGGFLFAPVLEGAGVPGEAVVLSGFLAVNAVLAALFLVMGRVAHVDESRAFARGFAALFLGELAGVALGGVLGAQSAATGAGALAAAIAGLAALFAYLFLFTERDFRALSLAVEHENRFDETCRAIAEQAGLSPREAEVLPLALRGRTGERIASELCIAKSTVDTHLRRIYAKCGVHSRQELIDYSEKAGR